MSAGPDVPGRVEITARALTALSRAVAAERLGAPAKRLRVDLGDHDGMLSLEVTGPIRAQDDVIGAATAAAERIRARVGELSGRKVGRAHIELTGIVREHEGRVR
ncbi:MULTISPECIES: hypothetical protein [unclassified Curtobacterium]|uniref:hypothetical protein n=1 Tax=unclassified Curtobacterium TaxID=257496 RepID=UPI0008251A5C|nr:MULTISPECIES: hypothetical protein [unclassified Curtobacterium]WIB01237.1 hypothetical protein QOL15_06000 [Curtobacterium sp. MCBA15_012]